MHDVLGVRLTPSCPKEPRKPAQMSDLVKMQQTKMLRRNFSAGGYNLVYAKKHRRRLRAPHISAP